ncbi:serine/threonine-protein kinase [Streptomyces chrestomyceticus]|uniref:serine/threonine-protein kinase n=1 Tax=Streptomyces chrestomyceticus TaxID=68185 RepID=UPI0019D2571B|nr:serine/threonine-protein kinase [Streptomyces chrestomyceticus]
MSESEERAGGVACQRRECPGTYEDVGGGELYCDTCGLAPVVSPEGMVGSPPTGVTAARRGVAGAGGYEGSGGSGGLGGSGGAGGSTGVGGSTGAGVAEGRGSGAGSDSGSGSGSGSETSAGGRTSASASARASARSSTSRRSVSGRLSRSLPGASTRSMSVSVRSAGRSSGTGSGPSRGRLGAGLVAVPEVPRPDPRTAVLENPEVPERKRFCSRGDCGAPVGRARGDRPGRTEGFCTKCGHPYSFVPKLRPGDVVHGSYEVVGCLAHGGLGWIYLAIDRAVSDRWVVLKGLLDTGDEEALAVAASERRFLAEIEHSNIVRIYNFVEHLDRTTGSLDGYIVMEYVGGKSLKDIANERRTARGRRDPLPVEQACAYGIEALEALGHLHSRNLLYCDFKVDNAIQQNDQLKLIDMGAVRRMDDDESAIYGTIGYQAPEVAAAGPSVASDLYTVARTLAVLTFDFQGYTNVFVDSLPDPDNIEVFRTYESFYRLLVRATDPDPARRFSSAAEMAEQLTGVLREVMALRTGEQRPALSTLFGPELRVVDTDVVARAEGDTSLLGGRAVPVGRKGWMGRKRQVVVGPAGGIGAPGGVGTGVRAGEGGGAVAGISAQPAGVSQAAVAAQAAVPAQVAYEVTSATGPQTMSGGAGALAGPAFTTAAGSTVGSASGVAAVTPGGVRGAPALRPLDTGLAVLALPVPRVDPADPNAGFLAGLLAAAPAELLGALRAAPADTMETRLRRLRAHLELGDGAAALRELRAVETEPGQGWDEDWRVVWYRGLVALTNDDRETAALSFDAMYDAFPGEPAPKLALAVCAEVLGQLDNAAEYYRLVWATDHSYVSAAFGLARVRLAAGDRAGAVAALESVPESSIHYTAARIAAVRARLRQRPAHDALLEDLRSAAGQVERLADSGLDAERRERLTTEVLGCALDWVLSGSRGAEQQGRTLPSGARGPGSGGAAARPGLLGSALDERGLRFGLERSFRLLARLAQRGEERIELVERANRFRPRTWV